tara:strand:+ start:47 stop:712 length:666 start_codon:yes stop_codon:yes gene_type:complete
MVNRISNSDIKNFIRRFFSAILFIPFIIVPIILKGYFLYAFYIFLLSLMTIELVDMSKISKKKTHIFIYLLICTLTIFTFILSILSSGNESLKIIEIIFIIWIFDTFCYLGGKTFNGKKLMPSISKGKTFNGLYSGIVATLIITSLYYLETQSDLYTIPILVIPVIILSFLGDLVVSVLKRSVNIKDSGYIIPGHGGIIDRMDSFVFVFFFLGIYSIIFVR